MGGDRSSTKKPGLYFQSPGLTLVILPPIPFGFIDFVPFESAVRKMPAASTCLHCDDAEDAGWLRLRSNRSICLRYQNDAELMMVPVVDRALKVFALPFTVLHLQLAERWIHAQRLM